MSKVSVEGRAMAGSPASYGFLVSDLRFAHFSGKDRYKFPNTKNN